MTDTTGPKNYENLKDRIYYSFWSWSLIKNCPHSFYLRVLQKIDTPKSASKHNAIQGSIPGSQSEDFFRLPIAQRDMNFFIETFEPYWQKFLKENYVDFAQVAKDHIRQKKLNILNDDPEFLWKMGYQLRHQETYEHTQNLMKMISTLGLHKLDAGTEVPFNITLEPAREDRGIKIPELAVGGRIDLEIRFSDTEVEIWDVKAVKSPSSLDSDQLLIYKMGRQAAGKTVRRVGYLHAKQGKVETKKFLPMHEDALRNQMRQSMYYFNTNQWPANYTPWKCGYCDVNQSCETYKNKAKHDEEIAKLKTGKVEF